jgi:ubiquinone/menaquinone biosynthesis C-methylase UbiE
MSFYAQVVFPWLCDLLLGQPLVARYRRELLATVHGDILEIGFGTGLNLPHHPPGVRRITAVDANAGMSRRAARRIERSGIEVEQGVLDCRQLPFADNAFDCVVSTFTLCSIEQVHDAVGEVYRVLKRGGRFLSMEHGLSPERGVQQWQRRLNWLEMRLAGGCRLDRDIKGLIAGQPFASVEIRESYLERTLRTHGFLSRGVARK